MSFLADLLSTVFERRDHGFHLGKDDDRPIEKLIVELIGATGDVSGQTIESSILDRYSRMDDDGRMDFFRYLAEEMTISPQAVREALDGFEAGQTRTRYHAFIQAAVPPGRN